MKFCRWILLQMLYVLIYKIFFQCVNEDRQKTGDGLWTFWSNQKVKVILCETCTNCRVYGYQSLLQISARLVKVFYHFVMSLVQAYIHTRRKYCISAVDYMITTQSHFSASVALIKSYKIMTTRDLKKPALGLLSNSQCVN